MRPTDSRVSQPKHLCARQKGRCSVASFNMREIPNSDSQTINRRLQRRRTTKHWKKPVSRFWKGSTLPDISTGRALVLQEMVASEQPTEVAGRLTCKPRTVPEHASWDKCFDLDDTICPVCKMELMFHLPTVGTVRTRSCKNIYGTQRALNKC